MGDATASVNHYHNLPEIIAFFCLHQIIVQISIYYTQYIFITSNYRVHKWINFKQICLPFFAEPKRIKKSELIY